jgi:CBS-domain-containing membrane protein
MTEDPVTCREDHNLEQAMEAMERHALTRVPIVDAAGRLVRIVARTDIARKNTPLKNESVLGPSRRARRK